MNRRDLFRWLAALPFMPAVLARTPITEGWAIRPVPFEPIVADWDTMPPSHLMRVRADYFSLLEPITYPVPSADWGKPISFVLWNGDEVSMNDENDWPLEPQSLIDMKYKPDLPEWW